MVSSNAMSLLFWILHLIYLQHFFEILSKFQIIKNATCIAQVFLKYPQNSILKIQKKHTGCEVSIMQNMVNTDLIEVRDKTS